MAPILTELLPHTWQAALGLIENRAAQRSERFWLRLYAAWTAFVNTDLTIS
jgi:hypothetical protein